MSRLFAVAPPGQESVVAAELSDLGFADLFVQKGGVQFTGDALRANRQSACATRILQRVARFNASSFTQLLKGASTVDWTVFGGLTPQATCRKSRLYHTGAVESRLAEVVPPGPGMLLARIVRDRCILSVDTSGERLHRRGWRVETGAAPLRETLAALILRIADWQPGEAVYDPMCGSGTFLVEAAVAAAGRWPGAQRRFACEEWLTDAPLPPRKAIDTVVSGSDRSGAAVGAAQRNAERAGVEIAISQSRAADVEVPAEKGLLVCNPPYGRRASVGSAFNELGALLAGPFSQWRAAILCPHQRFETALKRPILSRHSIQNGGLSLDLLLL